MIQAAVAVVGSVGTIGGIALSYHFHRQSQRAQEELRESQQKLQRELRKRKKITWDELPKKSRSLRDEIRREFDPDLIVTPGLRGGTILNLMYGVKENRLIYVGIREDTRGPRGLASKPKGYVLLNQTDKYNHYVPAGIREEDADRNVLILDDFVHTGESMMRFKENIVDLGFDPENVKTATIVCSEAAETGGKAPDFYSVTMPPEFEFPWGEAV